MQVRGEAENPTYPDDLKRSSDPGGPILEQKLDGLVQQKLAFEEDNRKGMNTSHQTDIKLLVVVQNEKILEKMKN